MAASAVLGSLGCTFDMATEACSVCVSGGWVAGQGRERGFMLGDSLFRERAWTCRRAQIYEGGNVSFADFDKVASDF